MHQAQLSNNTNVRLHAAVSLIAFLSLVHLRVALTVLVLDRTRRVDQRGIDDGALVQRQAAIPQIAVDHGQNPSRQFVFLQQASGVEDSGFVGNAHEAIEPLDLGALTRRLSPRGAAQPAGLRLCQRDLFQAQDRTRHLRLARRLLPGCWQPPRSLCPGQLLPPFRRRVGRPIPLGAGTGGRNEAAQARR